MMMANTALAQHHAVMTSEKVCISAHHLTAVRSATKAVRPTYNFLASEFTSGVVVCNSLLMFLSTQVAQQVHLGWNLPRTHAISSNNYLHFIADNLHNHTTDSKLT